MGYWTNPKIEDTAPFMARQWFSDLDTVILATDYWDRAGSKRNQEFPPLGAIREENACLGGGVYKNVGVDGRARFMWVWNNSGVSIAKGVPMVRRATRTVTNVLAESSVRLAFDDTSIVNNNDIGALIYCLDDAGAAGAAPEGEFGRVFWSGAMTSPLGVAGYGYKFQPDMTAALAVGDEVALIYHSHVLAAGAGAQLCDFRGVPVASGGIPTGYMGWACIDADAVACLALPAAGGAAITVSKGIIAGTAVFDDGATSAVPLILGYAIQALTADAVNRLFLASLHSNIIRGVSV
jgi:hypothetical protein